MRRHRLLSLVLGAALLMGPKQGRADDTDKSALKPDRPFLVEIEGQWSYIESEARLSSTIGTLQPILGPGQTSTETIKSPNNLGGEVRLLGPLLWGIGRPFIEGGAVTPVGRDIITSSNYGIPGQAPQSNASLEFDWEANTALGFAVDMPLGKSLLSLKPFVGFAWDAYVAQVNFFSAAGRGLIVPNNSTNITAHYTIGSAEFGGAASFQPISSIPVYIFGGGGWRKPLTNYHRHQCDNVASEAEHFEPPACGDYNFLGGGFFRTGIGVRF
ncbi:MAG TPA: hypothetical protein DEP35_22790 [Deltaproteobacteria bacterium]|jgi:hypothetical protein|nr:hypothetical protein [Deltaproteobacteria bacterium]